MARILSSVLRKVGLDREYWDFFKKAMYLAMPVAAQRVVGTFVNLLDNLMVGSLGDVSVSACSVANQFFLLYSCVIGGIIGGAVIISAQSWGDNNLDIIKKMLNASTFMCIVTAIIFFFITQVFAESIIQIYTDKDSLIVPGSSYLRIISFSFILFALTTAITMIFRTVGCIKLGFYVECVNSVINAFLNWVLIFGKFGMPALGLYGAAVATVISRCFGLAITIIYVFFLDKSLKYHLSNIMSFPDKNLWKTYIICGIPVLFGDTMMMLNSMIQTMITGRISYVYITANSIVHVIWQMAVLTAMGFEAAASIIIGGDIGNGDMELVQKDGERFFKLSIIQGLISAIVVIIVGPIILSFYKVSTEAIFMAKSMIYSAAFVVFIMVVQMITTRGVIRAGGKTRQLMVVDFFSAFGFGLPLGYIAAFVLKWPPFLIYIVIRGDYLIKAIWGIKKLKKKEWTERLIG